MMKLPTINLKYLCDIKSIKLDDIILINNQKYKVKMIGVKYNLYNGAWGNVEEHITYCKYNLIAYSLKDKNFVNINTK